MENEITEFIANTDGRFIIGLFCAGGIFMLICQAIGSIIETITDWAIQKIKNKYKENKKESVEHNI